MEDLEKFPHAYKGKTKGSADLKTLADDGAGSNIHGSTAIAGNDAAVTAAVVTAAHVSVMSVHEGQDGSNHGHDRGSGGDGGGG